MFKRRKQAQEVQLGQECREWLVAHSHELLRYARQKAGNGEDAEMLLSTVCTKVLRVYCNGGLPAERLKAYTLRAIHNQAVKLKQKMIRRTQAEQDFAQEQTDEATAFSPNDTHRQACMLMRRLPPELSEIVFLKIWGEMSYTEIAKQLNIGEAAVRFRYAKGLTLIRKQLTR